MKRAITLSLALAMALTLVPVGSAAAETTDWDEAQAVVRMVGIMVGDQNGSMSLDQPVTRAQFAKMLTMAAGKTQSGTGYAPFRDVTHTHWAAGYIKLASDSGWFLGYMDGTFRPDNTILYEEGATAVLRMLGYSESDYAGAYPSAQLSKFSALGLGDGLSLSRGDTLTRRDCVQIFYNVLNAENKEGKIHALSLGYSLDSDDRIDYQALLLDEAKGPFTAQSADWTAQLSFALDGATIYLDGKQTDSFTPALYDVYYYNADGAVLWVYTGKAVGMLTQVTPQQGDPTSATVAGVSYTLGKSAVSKLSAMGQFKVGDAVALLMGMDGVAVDVIDAESIDGLHYGVITKAGMETYTLGSGTRTDYMVTVAATTGDSYTYVCADTSLKVGTLVSAGYENGKPVVNKLTTKTRTGKVDSTGTRLGELKLADDIAILEVTADGRYRTVYPSRLAGCTLGSGDVRFYLLDSSGAIAHLILNDATGDMADYGILTALSEESVDQFDEHGVGITVRTGEYHYIIDGMSGTLKLSDRHLSLGAKGPAQFTLTDGAVTGIALLGEIEIAGVGATTVTAADGVSHTLGEDVQVYILQDDTYHPSALASVSEGYRLMGYTDSGHAAGGRVRIILATAK